MYPVPSHSILGRFLSKSGVNTSENRSDVPEPLYIHTDDVEGVPDSVEGFESILGTASAQQSPYDGLPISASLPQSFPPNSTASPAAMFLSGFSAPPPVLLQPDDEGEIVAGYTLGPVIGRGGFSTIRRASSSTSGGVVAVKIVRRSDLSKQGNVLLAQKRIDHEARIWSTLSHEHILPLFTSVHNSYADFFITLFCPAGSLFDILKREGQPALPQDDVGMMFRQLVRGIRYLHEDAGVVHRDLKLENILVDDTGACKITDFGMARKIGEVVEIDEEEEDLDNDGWVDVSHGLHRAASVSYSAPQRVKSKLPIHNSLMRPPSHGPRHRNSMTTSTQHSMPKGNFQPGSLPYASPELLLPPSSSDSRSPHPAQDMWALGVMLYTLISGRLPFVDSFEPRLQMKIIHGVFTMPSDVGRGTERILQGLIDTNTESRWTVAMVDEVAWGVGWGDEGNIVHETDEELRQETATSSSSRSQSRPHHISTIAEVEQGELYSAGSDAASRRSASRAQRSLSRAPLMARRRSHSQKSGRESKSASFCRTSSPSVSGLESSVLSIASLSTNFSVWSEPLEPDYEVLLSPERGNEERGRRLTKSYFTSMSRSPSPSVLPTTPIDISPRSISPPSLTEERPEGSRSSRSVPRGRLRFSRLTTQGQAKSSTHTPLESRGRTPDVFAGEEAQAESRWHFTAEEDGIGQAEDDLNEDSAASGMAMDQDYLTSADYDFNQNTSLHPLLSQSHTRPVLRHNPISIVQSKSDGSGNRIVPDFALDAAPRRVVHHVNDTLHRNHESFAARRGHHTSSLERTRYLHQHQLLPHHHNRRLPAQLDLHHHNIDVKSHQRAGSTPPAAVSDGGHVSALRFAENKRQSHSASHTPFSVNAHHLHSDSQASSCFASEQGGTNVRGLAASAAVTAVVVSGVTTFSTADAS